MLQATKIEEAGFDSALLGFGMAMKPRSAILKDWWNGKKKAQVYNAAKANAGRGKGHDKFLRMLQTWWVIDATRFLYQEIDTYKVGTTKSSASTMHRLCYESLELDSFYLDDLDEDDIKALQNLLTRINVAISEKKLKKAKQMLPEAYMLESVWNANYAVLNCIISQRSNHKMSGWQTLIECFRNQVDHPEFLINP